MALADLANNEVVDTLAFSLIVNALLVARYGPAVLEISSANPLRWASPGVKREAPPSAHHRA